MTGATLELAARYYRGLPIDRPGYEDVTLALCVEHTALVGMHCWNIGCPDGPPVDVDFCVGMGWPQSTQEAGRIMVEIIRPAMDAARSIGLRVYHVETDWMDEQYPDIESRRSRQPEILHPMQKQMMERAHGADYLQRSPLATMRRADSVAPAAGEPLMFYSDVLDNALQAHDIDTIIYMGFATDMCVLGAEGGARQMLARGYRCVLMRDATVGVETPESFPQRLSTNYGVHIFEWSLGFGTTAAQFGDAVAQIQGRRSS